MNGIMKVIGVNLTGGDVNWIGLEGRRSGGRVFLMPMNKVQFPTSHDTDFGNLIELKNIATATIQEVAPDKVAIAKAGTDCSPLRVKGEFVIELACAELGIQCRLIAPQTIFAAQKRRVLAATGSTFEAAFNGGAAIAPQYLEKAAYCAWTVLPEEEP